MALPIVSMEDPELFPKSGLLEIQTPLKQLDLAEFEKVILIDKF